MTADNNRQQSAVTVVRVTVVTFIVVRVTLMKVKVVTVDSDSGGSNLGEI